MNAKSACIITSLVALCSIVVLGDDAKKTASDPKPAAGPNLRIRLLTKETSLGVLPLMCDYTQAAVSPDQAHAVYPAFTNGGWRLFKDGVVMTAGQAYAQIAFPKFSPNGLRLAYHAKLRGGVWTTVVDDKESPTYDMPLATPAVFSPNSEHVAYFINRGGSQILVVDGKEERVCKDAYLENGKPSGKEAVDDRSLTFSPDGGRFAYVVVAAGRQWVVSNGVAHKKYDSISPPGPCFSPDGQHLVYGVRVNSNTCVIVRDGKEGSRIDAPGVRNLVFNCDGSKLAYLEIPKASGPRIGTGFRMVVDDTRQKAYPYGDPESFRFSPDGKRFMYVAATETLQQLLIVDGKEYGPYAGVAPNSWCFSPDSKHFAYGAAHGTVSCAVVDGDEFGRFEYFAGAAFSPDSLHCAFVAIRNQKAHVLVGSTESVGFDLVPIGGSERVHGNYRPVFDAARKLHLQAARNANLGDVELTRIDVEIASE